MGASSEFSSMIKSGRTVNQMSVNLGQPGASPTGPLQMCQSSYDNVGGAASSYYVTEDSFQSAEQNAFEHEEEARRLR
jgi:hypothetical protein